MTLTKGRINRTGRIVLADAALNVWEEDIPQVQEAREQWGRNFKHQVFKRIIQKLNRLGWKCVIPEEKITNYSLSFARNYRYCTKGDLKADLGLQGRHIEIRFFQSVNTPTRPDHEGRYEHNKEAIMPYLLKLEMERTRRQITNYLCNVFTGYVVQERDPEMGFLGVTALEWIQNHIRKCWHYNKDIDRRLGEDRPGNNRSADKLTVTHGKKVWITDYKGRIRTGTAYYNINNMWWVITGKYERFNQASFKIFVNQPKDLRTKLNHERKERRLTELLTKSIESMDFEKCVILRNILHPDHPSSKSSPKK